MIPILLHLQNVIDGDLCEQFNSLDPAKQKSIAEDLDRNPSEVLSYFILILNSCHKFYYFIITRGIILFQVSKKLEDLRTRYAF